MGTAFPYPVMELLPNLGEGKVIDGSAPIAVANLLAHQATKDSMEEARQLDVAVEFPNEDYMEMDIEDVVNKIQLQEPINEDGVKSGK